MPWQDFRQGVSIFLHISPPRLLQEYSNSSVWLVCWFMEKKYTHLDVPSHLISTQLRTFELTITFVTLRKTKCHRPLTSKHCYNSCNRSGPLCQEECQHLLEVILGIDWQPRAFYSTQRDTNIWPQEVLENNMIITNLNMYFWQDLSAACRHRSTF